MAKKYLGGRKDIRGFQPHKCEDKSRAGNPEAGAPQWKKRPAGRPEHGRICSQIIDGTNTLVYGVTLDRPYNASNDLRRIATGPLRASVMLARPAKTDEEMVSYAQVLKPESKTPYWTRAAVDFTGRGANEKVSIRPDYTQALVLEGPRIYLGDLGSVNVEGGSYKLNPNAGVWVRTI
ncbi:MAG: hypothetical protein JW727_01340 [Candidatus Aenigmarchaeota archaeon]|nr:hypothetical protein [Candidatus Aenigmarchaeota archaeon]